MPSRLKSLSSSVEKHIRDRPELVVLNDRTLYCNACSHNLRVTKNNMKSTIDAHLNTSKHQSNNKLWSKQRLSQPQITTVMQPSFNEYFHDVAQLFVGLNIPWYRVNDSAFKTFSRRWCNSITPDESTVRKLYLPHLYRDRIKAIKRAIGDNLIYLQVDETSDYQQRPLVSILVGVLDGQKPKSYIFDLVRLEKPPDSILIAQVIGNTLSQLWDGSIRYDKFRVLVSDQAAYMLKVGRDLKRTFYPDLMHVTCLAHALHNVCQLARVQYPKVDQLVRHFRKSFVKCPRRKHELSDFMVLPLPKFPVDSRWGTWIHFCSFLLNGYDKIKDYVDIIQGEKNNSLVCLSDIMEDPETKDQLTGVYQLLFLCDSIKRLEKNGLTIHEQKGIIDEALERLEEPFKAKLLDLLSKNPSYDAIFKLESMEERLKLLYTPLVSVDVERSFSAINLIDTARRQNLTTENLKQYAIVYVNSKFDTEEVTIRID